MISINNSTPAKAQLLFVLRNADLQSVADQVFVKQVTFTKYAITNITALAKTGGTTVACLGGIYPAASKAGTPFVAAVQSWLGLTAANKIIAPTLTAVLGTDVQAATPFFSLSTGSTGACTSDIFIFGYILD